MQSHSLSNGVKEGLIEQPQDGPGAHSIDVLLTGEPLEGLWPSGSFPPALPFVA